MGPIDGKEGAPVSKNTYQMGDRVRVTYDTVVVDANFPESYGVRVKTPVSVAREAEDAKNGMQAPTATLTVPVQYLTRLGPESDPVGTTRVRPGKDFMVVTKVQDNVGRPWRVVASAHPSQIGMGRADDEVTDWDVLGA